MNLNFRAQYLQEVERLKLDEDMCPYGGMASDGSASEEEFLTRMKQLSLGATWRDVFPDIPAHWDLADPDTWTYPYRPMFSFDYPSLPTGPVIMVASPLDAPDEILTTLLGAARHDGFNVYGAGYIPIENPEWPVREIRIVLHHTTTETQFSDFLEWVERYPGVTCHGASRGVDEQWAPESGA